MEIIYATKQEEKEGVREREREFQQCCQKSVVSPEQRGFLVRTSLPCYSQYVDKSSHSFRESEINFYRTVILIWRELLLSEEKNLRAISKHIVTIVFLFICPELTTILWPYFF